MAYISRDHTVNKRTPKFKDASNSHIFTGETPALGGDFHKNLNIKTRKTFTNVFAYRDALVCDEAHYHISTIEDGLNEKTESQK